MITKEQTVLKLVCLNNTGHVYSRVHSWVLINTLDQLLIDTQLALHRHLGWHSFDISSWLTVSRESTNFWSIHMSWSTLERLSTDYWSSVDSVNRVSIRDDRDHSLHENTCQPPGENRSPETDVRGQVSGSEHISAPNGGYCFMHVLIMRAFWLVNQLWFILPLNSKRKKIACLLSYIKAIDNKRLWFRGINHLRFRYNTRRVRKSLACGSRDLRIPHVFYQHAARFVSL